MKTKKPSAYRQWLVTLEPIDRLKHEKDVSDMAKVTAAAWTMSACVGMLAHFVGGSGNMVFLAGVSSLTWWYATVAFYMLSAPARHQRQEKLDKEVAAPEPIPMKEPFKGNKITKPRPERVNG